MSKPEIKKYIVYVEDEYGNKTSRQFHLETTAAAIEGLGEALDRYIENFVTPEINEAGSIDRFLMNLNSLPNI